jgi:phytoene desaturase
VELRSLTPFYTLRFDDGTTFDCSADPRRCGPRSRASAPATSRAIERFMEVSERLCRIGFEELGHVAFGSVMDMARVAPELLKLRAWRSGPCPRRRPCP